MFILKTTKNFLGPKMSLYLKERERENQENSYECLKDLFLEPQSLENHFNPSRNIEANVKLICFGIVF